MKNSVEIKIKLRSIEVIKERDFNEDYELHERIRKWIQVVQKEYTNRGSELISIKINGEDRTDVFIRRRDIERPDGIH
jgi:hypothetical protein